MVTCRICGIRPPRVQRKTCPSCDQRLYRERKGRKNPPLTPRAQQAKNIGEEIAWFKSFGMPDARVAERLGISVQAVERRRFHRNGQPAGAKPEEGETA